MMAPSSSTPPAVDRVQFHTRHLLLLTVALAVAFLVGRSTAATAVDLVMAVLAALIAFGVGYQAADLWSHGRPADADHETQFGWRFAVGWRVGIVGVLIICGVLKSQTAAPQNSWIALGERPGWFADALLQCAMWVALCGTPLARSRTLSRPAPVRRIAALVFGILAVGLLAAGLGSITYLVYLAIVGVDYAQPRWLAGESLGGFPPRLWRELESAFVTRTLLAAACLPIAVLALRDAAGPQRPVGRVVAGGAVWLAAISCTLAVVVWGYRVAIPVIAPHSLGVSLDKGAGAWTAGILLAMVSVTAFAYHAARRPLSTESASAWAKNGAFYFHENRFVLAVLVAVLLGWFATQPTLTRAIARFLVDPMLLAESMGVAWGRVGWMMLPLLLTAGRCLTARRDAVAGPRRTVPDPLPPVPFCLVWCAFSVTTVLGAVTLTWSSLAIWMGVFGH